MHDAGVKYQKLVRTARAIVAIPMIFATAAVAASMIAGRHLLLADHLASVVVGTSVFASLTGLALTVVALRDLRRERGEPDNLWISDEVQRFVKDVIGARAS